MVILISFSPNDLHVFAEALCINVVVWLSKGLASMRTRPYSAYFYCLWKTVYPVEEDWKEIEMGKFPFKRWLCKQTTLCSGGAQIQRSMFSKRYRYSCSTVRFTEERLETGDWRGGGCHWLSSPLAEFHWDLGPCLVCMFSVDSIHPPA